MEDNVWKTKFEIEMMHVGGKLNTIEQKLDAIADKIVGQSLQVNRVPAIEQDLSKLEDEVKKHIVDYSTSKGKWSVWVIILTLFISGAVGAFFHVVKASSETAIHKKK